MPRRGGIRPDGRTWRNARAWKQGFPSVLVRGACPLWWALLTESVAADPHAMAALTNAMAEGACDPMAIGARKGWWPAGTKAPVPFQQAMAELEWPSEEAA